MREVPSAGHKQVRDYLPPPLGVCFQKASNAWVLAPRIRRGHDHRDPVMSKLEQVGSGSHETFLFFDDNSHDFFTWPRGTEEGHNGNALSCEFIQGLGPSAVHFNRNSDQPRDSIATQEVEIGDLFVWVLVCFLEYRRGPRHRGRL